MGCAEDEYVKSPRCFLQLALARMKKRNRIHTDGIEAQRQQKREIGRQGRPQPDMLRLR
jgi:hypothetical protein